jgi:MFS-type transporter involved in bile tolerance (Atg22 family)
LYLKKVGLEDKMNTPETIKIVGVVASVVLPLFNIPLILKIRKRGSSKDYSLTWTFGILGCLLLMLPSALLTPDIVFKVFGIINLVTFSIVVFYILKYHSHKPV